MLAPYMERGLSVDGRADELLENGVGRLCCAHLSLQGDSLMQTGGLDKW